MNENVLQNILEVNFLNNTVYDYIVFVGLFFIFLIIFKVIKNIILKKLFILSQKTKTDLDNTLISILRDLKLEFYVFLAFFLSVKSIQVSDFFSSVVHWALIIWVTYIVIVSLQKLITYFFYKKISKESGNVAQALKTLNIIARSILWFLGILFILSNMGINITSVVAGLGIGGIAIALALQNILTDLFSSFAIYFDKPFEVGDFIIIGDKIGVVEKIGIKTTRIRALQGEEIVISNRELTTIQIQNFKKLKERRVTFNFRLTYDTSVEKLKRTKNIIKEIFDKIPEVRLDRCHFYRFEDSSLFHEVVYYVSSPEYNVYMDIQEKINLELKELLEKESIQMAFPTRTLHINEKKSQ